MTTTLISSDIDFEAEGKQTGFLRLPHSEHRSAYGWIPVPLVVIANGDGPTALLLAGVHGDEYEGQIALSKLSRSMTADQVQGRLIILPMTNFPAGEAGLRTSPIDDGNLNRAFPGNPQGTPTEMMAHYIEFVLMPMADYMVDLHSGGTSLYYPPTLLRGAGHSPEEAVRLKALQVGFDLPYAWVFSSGGGPTSTARTALGAANRNGVTGVMAELGGGGGVNKDILQQTERGLLRVLSSLNILNGYTSDPARGTRELTVAGSVYAGQPGVFEPFKNIADAVRQNEIVGVIHSPETPWKDPDTVASPYDGIVLCKRTLGQVKRGDAVFQIAKDVATD